MSETSGGTGGPRLDSVGHSILWRIRDAARYLATIIPNVASSPGSFGEDEGEKGFQHRFHESMTPQRMNRLLVAHSVLEASGVFISQPFSTN